AVSSFEDVRKLSRGKFDARNFQHVGPDSAAHRVEFRFWAGSVDKGVWQAHAELSAAMLAAAKDPSIDAQLEQLLADPLLLGHSPAGLPQLAQLLGLLPMSPESQQQAVELFAATAPWKGDGRSDFRLRSQTVGLPGDRGLYFPAAGQPVATAVQVAQTAQSHPGADLVLADLAAGTDRIGLWNGRTLDGNLFAGNIRYRGIGHGKPVVLAMSGAARTNWFPGFTDSFDPVLTAPRPAFTADGRLVAVRHTVGPDGRVRVEQDPQGWVQHSAAGSVATGEADLNRALASLDPRGDEKEQLASRIDDSLQRAQQYLNALPGDALPQQRGQIMQWATARNAILERTEADALRGYERSAGELLHQARASWAEKVHADARQRVAAGQPAVIFHADGLPGAATGREDVRLGFEVEYQLPAERFDDRAEALAQHLHREGFIEREDGEPALLDAEDEVVGERLEQDSWVLVEEASEENTVEVVSPVLRPGDDPGTWNWVAKLLDIGGQARGNPANSGGHVNVSLAGGMTPGEYGQLAQLGKAFEPLLFRLGNNPRGLAHRSLTFAGPNPLPPDSSEVRTWADVTALSRDKHDAINFHHVHGTPDDRVEFRFWAASLDPGVWQVHAEISTAMLLAAKDPSIRAKLTELLTEPPLLGRGDVDQPRLLMDFLDLVPLSPAAQQQVVELFASTDPWRSNGGNDEHFRANTLSIGTDGLFYPRQRYSVPAAMQVVRTVQRYPDTDLVLANLRPGTDQVELWNGDALPGDRFADVIRARGAGLNNRTVLAMSGAAETPWFRPMVEFGDHPVLAASKVAMTPDGRLLAVRSALRQQDGTVRFEPDPQGWVEYHPD
ncbi:MAG: hypothetical protein IJH84_05140, partial [Saccharopolyspora sp.]|uniref:hypothetical protein n=1 Tax=Saccharopolyspora sp. TaxID=33915 RepID=UPI0025CED1AC